MRANADRPGITLAFFLKWNRKHFFNPFYTVSTKKFRYDRPVNVEFVRNSFLIDFI